MNENGHDVENDYDNFMEARIHEFEEMLLIQRCITEEWKLLFMDQKELVDAYKKKIEDYEKR